MSLFLGKIHYWLFNKVLRFEGLEGEIIKLAKDKVIDVEKLLIQVIFMDGYKEKFIVLKEEWLLGQRLY